MQGLKGRLRPVADRLLFSADTDPRGIQIILLLAVAVNTAIFTFAEGSVDLTWWALAGTGVLLGASALAFWASSESRRDLFAVGIPVLDLVALGLWRLDPAAGSLGMLMIVPALWLCYTFGTRAALFMAIAMLYLFSAPLLIFQGVEAETLSRAIFAFVAIVWASTAIARGMEQNDEAFEAARRDHLAYRSAVVEQENTRRINLAILEASDVALAIIEKDGSIGAENAAFRALVERHRLAGGVTYGPDGVTVLAPEDHIFTRARSGEEFSHERVWIGDPNTDRVALACSARPVLNQSGEFVGAALSATDITEWMRTMQMREDFVASVSHELRTPLTSIHGYVSIMLDDPQDLPEQQSQHLKVVARNADRLHRLVNDLLHTAQSDRGQLAMTRETSDVTEIVRWSVEAARSFAEPQQVSLEVSAPPFLQVDVDPQRYSQMVDNLLSNAVKFTPQGGKVSVQLSMSSGELALTVRDTGVGIGAMDQQGLFNRFFRAKSTEWQSIQGIGLGLSIVKQIVEAHDGSIEMESELGVGTCVQVRIPIGVREVITSA